MAKPQSAVILNGHKIPINGPVLWDRVTLFPDQLTQQAPTNADFKPVRKQTWGSLRGGAGVEKWSPEVNDRYWDAVDVDTSQRTQTIGPLVTTLGSFGASPVRLIKHNGEIWAIAHQLIQSWDGDSWTSHKTDLDNPTDAILFYGAS